MRTIKYFALFSAVGLLCACKAQTAADNIIPSDDGLFPFVISFAGADNATDFSALLEAPAGKDGFIRVEGDHFVNDKGRVKLNATNLTASANFPTHEQAERMAARMARFGINCVRLHFMDCSYGPEFFPLSVEGCIFANDGSDRNFNPEMLDRLDYMISRFKEKGIYVDVNLYVARQKYAMKALNAVNADVQAKEREYARDLLTHVNPYTGLSLADDPVVALIELNNEDALFTSYMNGAVRKPEWPTVKQLKDGSVDEKTKREFFHTLEKYESEHWNNMYDYLKKEIRVKAPVTSTQASYSMPSTFERMDFNDMHAYWKHPTINVYWKQNNVAMVNSTDGGELPGIASRRYAGKPFTVSEYNHPYPAFYGAEGQPIIHAYAAFQGWDGVFSYSWNNRFDEEPMSMEYFFSYTARTDAMAHFNACATMYLRGDVREAETDIRPVVPMKAFEDDFVKTPSASSDAVRLIKEQTDGRITRKHMLAHKIVTDIYKTEPVRFEEEEMGDVIFSDTREIEWNNSEPGHGMFIVRTGNSKFFTGFPAGRVVDLGDGVSVALGKTKLGWATISLASKEGNGMLSGSTLLAATGFTHNKDAKFTVEKDAEGKPTTYISCRLKDWGTAPMMTEGINASVTLASEADATKCWALDENGDRKIEVPVKKNSEGKAVIEISEKYQTIWYEINVE